ncbi:hypothetical protein BH23VER1_BH23VER1_04040 [soil metagenome]
MIKRILVPLDISPFAECATAYACKVAKAHAGATVTGMTVIDIPEILTTNIPVHAVLVSDWDAAAAHMQRDAAAKLATARETFRATCERNRVAHEEFALKGAPAQSILDATFYHDLVVVGQRTYFHFETQGHQADGQSLKDILSSTPAPVLAVPSSPTRPLDSVLVAYDGSLNAARALRDFATLAAPFDPEVVVLTAGADGEHAAHHLAQAQSYLEAHGFAKLTTVATKAKIIEVVESEYLPWADLIVAGIHSRRHLRDLFVGSFTKFLIGRCQTPLLLG